MKNECSYNTITATSCHNQRVILRADLNVPLTGTMIDDDFRLQELRPTLDLLLAQQATILLITHLGRPDKNGYAPSTSIIATWLQKHGYKAFFAPTIAAAHEQIKLHPNTVIVLKNIRTFTGEMTQDNAFAQELAQLGDCYINDAFGTLHRNDTSISLVPRCFTPEKRFIGLLVARELHALAPLMRAMQNHERELLDAHPHDAQHHTALHPFVVVLGGGKVADKIPLINGLLGKADTLLLCPAIVFTFMKAQEIPVGNSLVDDTCLDTCKEIIDRASTTKTELIMPIDLQVAKGSLDGQLAYKKIDQLAPNDIGITLGPLSIALFTHKITQARTLFFNAAMGFTQRPETLAATKKLIEAIGTSSTYGVIGGGDSVAIAHSCAQGTGIHHLSTGGGATLAYLSGAPLPGLEPLCSKQ